MNVALTAYTDSITVLTCTLPLVVAMVTDSDCIVVVAMVADSDCILVVSVVPTDTGVGSACRVDEIIM